MDFIEEQARRNWNAMRYNARIELERKIKWMSNKNLAAFMNENNIDSQVDKNFVRLHRDLCENITLVSLLDRMFPET